MKEKMNRILVGKPEGRRPLGRPEALETKQLYCLIFLGKAQ
jgi:hypothetical protein